MAPLRLRAGRADGFVVHQGPRPGVRVGAPQVLSVPPGRHEALTRTEDEQ